MANDSVIEVLQGELERLFELDEMMHLSEDLLGFDPQQVGGTGSKGAFARSLVGYCVDQEAIDALVDAITLSSDDADAGLRAAVQAAPNGELKPGTRVGGLRVVKKIGEGGLSIVYLAESEGQSGELQRAALKVIRPQFARDRGAVHRFTTVSRIMQSLRSPGLAQILGVGQLDDARPWVAATYLSGQTLAQRVKRTGSLHINEARSIFTGVLQGLMTLHARGLLHGDIKVENVFVVRPANEDGGGEPTGVLVDGGGDRLFTRTRVEAATTGLLPVLGTAKAIAPEQARGLEPDQRADIYQMGTLMYETLTGRPPFEGESAIDVIAQHLSVLPEPPSVHARKGWVSPALDELVLRALAKDPEERFASAAELLSELDRAARKPAVQRPLDEGAFQEARRGLLVEPGNETRAERLEEVAREANAFSRAAEALQEVANATRDPEQKLGLLFRVARLYDTELKEATRAEAAYQQILELEPENEVALRGVETQKRAAGDHEGLIGVLLDRTERTTAPAARKPLLHEVATLYDKQLRDVDNALLAWTQALVNDPRDAEAQKQIERLAGNVEARWGEVLEMLSQSAQQTHATLTSDEDTQRAAAQERLAQANAALEQVRAEQGAQVAARQNDLEARQSQVGERLQVAEQALAQAQGEADQIEAQLEAAARYVDELTQGAETSRSSAETTRANAEAHVEAYEQLEQETAGQPTAEQQSELERIAGEAESLVAAAEEAEGEADRAEAALEQARASLAEVQQTLDAAFARVQEAEAAHAFEHEGAEQVAGGLETGLTADEQAERSAAEREVTAAQVALEAFEQRDEGEAASERERQRADLAQTYAVMGRFYGERLNRADFALSCFTQALAVEPSHDGAYEGIADLYRSSQAWSELAAMLLQRAEHAKSPLKGRDYRTEAAAIVANKLNDQAQARAQLERVLADDPDHPQAQRALGDILREAQDWAALAEVLERRAHSAKGKDRAEALLSLSELYEDRLDALDKAAARYQAVIEIEPRELRAWKGLERIHARNQNFEGLVESLRAQVDLSPTPKQRIALLERIGLLLEEEFVDHAQAADRFEDIISIDGGHEGANSALERLYRHLQRYEDLVETLDRHAGSSADDKRKVELMLQAARVLAVDIGSPERAIETYEQVLSVDEQQSEALSELARLKTTSGDVAAAVVAVERLADQAEDDIKEAQLLIRAGRLLHDAGDRDAAIIRYKRALDLDRNAGDAANALRDIYKQRGDARGAAEMLVHAIQIADGDIKRAALLAELGMLYRDQLEEPEQAKVALDEALSLDPTNTVAAAGLARIAFSEQRLSDAVEHFEAALGRIDEIAADHGAELCVEAADAYKALGEPTKAVEALKRARDLLPEDLNYAERYARAVMESGDPAAAERLYERMLEQWSSELDVADKIRLLLALANAQLGTKRAKRAIETCQRVFELRPEDAGALEVMTRAQELVQNWPEVISLLQLRARRAIDENEMFDLLVQTGDVFLEKVRDREAASQTYVMALDVNPENRNLLTKLMAVYSDAQDWPRLIEIILRIAEMVEDSAQLAKYYNTAAAIAQQELGRFDEAANYYEESLAHLPPDVGDPQFQGLTQCLTENQDWERLERAYETRITRLREAGADNPRIAALLDACGDIVQNRLGRLNDALRMYEEALELDPADENRRKALTAIYTKEPKRFFQRAVAAHRHDLENDPYRIESLQALRKVYTSGKKPDESWCICQALRCLKMADVDEEKFFKKYRLTKLPKVKLPITDDVWRELVVHPAQDPTLTAIFATLQPAVIMAQAQPLAAFGIDERYRVDLANDPTAMARMLAHVAETTTTHLPPVYHCPQDQGGLSFLFTAPPAVGIGEGAKAGGPQQALAFVAGRHLSYYRPGHFLRQLVPTGTGLRAWLIGAIRTVSPKFPAPANMETHVRECVGAIAQQLVGPQRDALRSMTQKLLEAAPELDMKAWMGGVDLTADRIGFVLSNDLKIANAVIEASPEDAAGVGRRERARELLAYSTSEQYFELRKRIGIALGI
jgi:tetratricopeptide (TPR) repeat protein